tara:strand:- start:27339 stop:27827 length:489 start_codon:yes stop_codon:yes gene_type:complete
MRSSAIVLLFVLASCGASTPMAEVEAPMSTVPQDQQTAIRGVVEQYRQAYEVGSAEALHELYAKDLDLVLVNQGKVHQGWTSVQAFLTSRLEGASQVRMSIKDISIREFGPDGAILTATRTSSIGDGSVSVTETGVLSLVLQNQEGQWKVVAEHFSFPTSRS